jgi:hypothetical protein
MKISRDRSTLEWLSLAVGKQLSKATALVFQSRDETTATVTQELSLEFEGISASKIFCDADGASLCWDESKLTPFSMDEYGELVLSVLSETDNLWKELVHKQLEQVYLIESTREETVFALRLVFAKNLEVVIANLGDELVVQKQLPEDVMEEEQGRYWKIEGCQIN